MRVRPFNGREKDRNARGIIKMKGPVTTIVNPETEEEKEFAFDHSYWSHDGFVEDERGYNTAEGASPSPSGTPYASQADVYNHLGKSMLENAWAGYNCTMFAYGQTGSGKSYSFVGYGSNEGILPQSCTEIFQRVADDGRWHRLPEWQAAAR